MGTLSIKISFDRNIYTSPDIFKATVTLTNEKLSKLDSLVVEILGFEEIFFCGIKKSIKPVKETRIFFNKSITLLSTDQTEWTLSPGQHVFPVVFPIPHGLPSSFRAVRNDYNYGVIEYRLKLRTKPKQVDKTKVFSVINPDEDSSWELAGRESYSLQFQKDFNIKHFSFIPRGSINTIVCLERDRIRPGETIYSLLTLDTSKSKVDIEGVEVYISTTVDLYAGKSKNFRFELKTPSIKGPPVPSGLKREVCPISLSLPFDFPRTFKSEMIQVWHSLVVTFTIPGTRNQELRLPFKVYGFADRIQSRSNERKRDEVIYIARQLDSIENKADDPPPTYTEEPQTKILYIAETGKDEDTNDED